jgi:hypothetical protein
MESIKIHLDPMQVCRKIVFFKKNAYFKSLDKMINAMVILKHSKKKWYEFFRACSGFWFDGENEQKFALMRRKKRSVAALHEHFCNEIGVNFGHL